MAPRHRVTACLLTAAIALGLAACATPSAQVAQAPAAARAAAPATPDQLYPQLFEAVQMGRVFEDQKHFVDMTVRGAPARVEAEYLAARGQPGFDLKAFVAAHFDEDPPLQVPKLAQDTDLRGHIDALWPVLTRSFRQVPPYSSALALPEPTVVPGGRFREVYYWDSYFTMLGLFESGRGALARQMLENFAYQVDTYGHIPNGTRSYYLSRSQPPFFAFMVSEAAAQQGDEVRRRYLPQLQAEYAYWMRGSEALKPGQASARVVRLADGSLLNRYWDDRDIPRQEAWAHDVATAAQVRDTRPAGEVYRDLRAAAESGWDFSSRWFDDPQQLGSIHTTQIVPVDLNSLMYHLEATLAAACAQQPGACRIDYAARAAQRQAAIERHLWNPAGYYADYDLRTRAPRDRVTAAMLFPLFAGLASPEHAQRTAATVQAQLVGPGGLVTTPVRSGQQWDAPNGWAPLQWVAVDGLRRYGQDALAERIGRAFLARVSGVFDAEHKLTEKYDVLVTGQRAGGGEYPNQDGFGWTNGVTLRLLDLYPPSAR
ncbi:alpha,alpha-trehalase TreA [Pseudoxanthomonas winnipegensis]|uniref:Alpha,alpha-trehalase TreA n=1 Tax=Pseudoxanthomonas winnipegensis TaxID=2480810 RepID=A0ABY1WJC5_9GAMM|nr:alpha,alpha-trehalase TreA [Pseudoxanthomonas winnipegensis]TAA22756.1 alpha,alpha-trehalase TreA [Pseudoxanthomonas winnipegensis]TAH73168.1 alpha,alpha-trehalase TreA [Pseudoxanthomonas winnipegensis]